MLSHERLDLFQRHCFAIDRRHERLGDFACFVIGDANDSDVGHLWMGDDQRFKLGRRDLKALELDELLQAIHNRHVPKLVDDRDVAGMQPTVSIDGRSSGFGVVEVALHHLRTTDPELATVANTLVLATNGVDDAALGVGCGNAARSRPVIAFDGAVTDRAEFGHAEALNNFATKTDAGFSGQFSAERCRTRENLTDRRHVVLVHDRMLGEAEDDWRHGEEAGDLEVLDCL